MLGHMHCVCARACKSFLPSLCINVFVCIFCAPYCPDLVAGEMAVLRIIRIILYFVLYLYYVLSYPGGGRAASRAAGVASGRQGVRVSGLQGVRATG